MKRFAWLVAFVPVVLGLVVMILVQVLVKPLPVLEVRADIGMTALLLGMAISLGLGIWQAARRRESRLARLSLLEERGRQADAHRRFLRRLDHQLKNPLTALRAALANLPQDGPALQDASRQAERLSRLVGDLRKLAELEDLPLERTAVDVPALLEELVEAVRSVPAYRNRRVDVSVSRIPWSPPPVPADPDLLGLALYNLIENAVKYSGPQDAVEVRVLEDGRRLIVEVADSGPGVAASDLPHLFEELFRGDNARGLEGSGLGLALVRRVIEQHGGEVEVRSRREGQKGTVFTVRLPLGK
jgi:two-component system OmpR family sensor kinase